MTLRFTLLFFLSIGLLTACSDDDDNGSENEECNTTGMRYSENIKPIIDANCATSGCHAAGYRAMTTFESVREYALDGSLVNRITLPASNPASMPPSGPLDDCTIKKIAEWVNDGAPE